MFSLTTFKATETPNFSASVGSDTSRVLDTACWCIAKFISLLDIEGLFMSEQASMTASDLGINFIKCYVWLAHDAAVNSYVAYQLRPKLHIFHHITLRLKKFNLNPKTLSCFSDEDFVRIVCALAVGGHHHGIATQLIYKFIPSALL